MNSLTRRIAGASRRRPRGRPIGQRSRMPGPAHTAGYHMLIEPGTGTGIQPAHSLITSDGAIIPATGPGGWDHTVTAGRIQ